MATILNALKNIGNGVIIFWEAYLEFLCELANNKDRLTAYGSVMALLILTVLCMFGAALIIFGLVFFVFCTPWPIKLAILVIGSVPLLVMRYAKKYKKNESDDDIW